MASCAVIPGPALIGFAMAFDECYGKPSAGPLPIIAPAVIGGVLLPFVCVRCGAVQSAAVGAKAGKYHDPARGHSWCPFCGGRYLLDPKGAPLVGSLEAGATHAPARINGQASHALTPARGLEFFACS